MSIGWGVFSMLVACVWMFFSKSIHLKNKDIDARSIGSMMLDVVLWFGGFSFLIANLKDHFSWIIGGMILAAVIIIAQGTYALLVPRKQS